MKIQTSREGTHRDYRWKLKVRSEGYELDQFGDTTLHVFDGQYGIYIERHHSDATTLKELEQRVTSLIDDIHDDENIGQCSACDCLYNRTVNNQVYEQDFSWADRHIFTHGMNPRYKAAPTDEAAETCVYSTGFLFDTIHVITHFWDTNPFFSDEELVECNSLVITQGFERTTPDGTVRSFDELQEKFEEIKHTTPDGNDNREKRDDLLELLDWTLKREDRFRTNRRFKYKHHR